MNDARVADADDRYRASTPGLAPHTGGSLVAAYLDAAEVHDLAVFTPDDVAGAIVAVLHIVSQSATAANTSSTTDASSSRSASRYAASSLPPV